MFNASGLEPCRGRVPRALPGLAADEPRNHPHPPRGDASRRTRPEDAVESDRGIDRGALRFDLNLESHERRVAATYRGYSWAGAGPGSRQLYLWGVPLGERSWWKRTKDRLYDRLNRRVTLNCFEFRRDRVPDFLRRLNRYRPEAIVAYTNPLYAFARVLEEQRLVPYSPKSIVVGAEKIYPFQRELIERVFRAPVFETYGAREFMLIGAECDRHAGLHLTTENLVVVQETLDRVQLPAPKNADVRSEELVGRASQEVGAKIANVDADVWNGVNRVDKDQRSHPVGHCSDFANRIDSADRVGGQPDCQNAGPLSEKAFEVVKSECAVRRIDIQVADRRAGVGRCQHSRRDIGVVIQSGHDDLISRPPGSCERSAERERQARHVLAEHDFIGVVGSEQIGNGAMCFLNEGSDLSTGGKQSAFIGISMREAIGHGINHDLRHLASAGFVEERGGLPTYLPSKSRELPPTGLDIQAAHHVRLRCERLTWCLYFIPRHFGFFKSENTTQDGFPTGT